MNETISSNFKAIELLLPPPWIAIMSKNGEKVYINTITGESTNIHPMKRILDENETKTEINDQIIQESPENNHENITSPTINRLPNLLYADFQCKWKDVNVSGKMKTNTLTLRFYQDQSVDITIEGINNTWQLSHLSGLYGSLNRYDLFMGSSVRIFGRNMTISTVVQVWIMDEIQQAGMFLLRKQAWIIDKIEKVGKTPLVKAYKLQNPEITHKKTSHTIAHVNLRKIYQENMKLCDQLHQLGLNHLVIEVNSLFDDKYLFWRYSSA